MRLTSLPCALVTTALALAAASALSACGGDSSTKTITTTITTSSDTPKEQDDQARSAGQSLAAALERCARKRGGYDQCTSPATLAPRGVQMGIGAGLVEIKATSPANYSLVSRSESGHIFEYSKTVQGEVVRTCKPPGAGGCPADGRW
jgi:hypothetical protein